jgi:hypothetical protein
MALHLPLVPAKAGIQMANAAVALEGAQFVQPTSESYDLGPGLRRDERV